jgi:hypothetical protein
MFQPGIDMKDVTTGSDKFDGICSVGDKVVAAPCDSDKLLLFDPATKVVEGIDVTSVATGNYKFRGICTAGGKVIAAPLMSNKLLLFDPITKIVEGIDVRHVATGDRLEDKMTWRLGKGFFKSDQALPR